jgi:hypothetical protein
MSGSFDQNERALGAQYTLETLRNLITESNQQTFTRTALINMISWMLDAISAADEQPHQYDELAEVLLAGAKVEMPSEPKQ